MSDSTLKFIKEMGIDSSTPTPAVDGLDNNTEDFVQDSTTEESTVTNEDTAPDISVELRKQIEGLEKRISDKDEYINILREQSKAKEEQSSMEEVNTQVDFWEDPDSTIKQMQDTIRMQSMQIQETVYANTVENYWKTVNPDALRSAVATDADFAKQFNNSNEPYKVAYEYLSNKNKAKETESQTLREQIKAELLKEMGLDKPKKEGIPSMGKMGGNSTTSRSEAPDDGFAAVFGRKF